MMILQISALYPETAGWRDGHIPCSRLLHPAILSFLMPAPFTIRSLMTLGLLLLAATASSDAQQTEARGYLLGGGYGRGSATISFDEGSRLDSIWCCVPPGNGKLRASISMVG